MSRPIAVITGDMHFTVATLDVATEALRHVLRYAKMLKVPAVLNGDTLDGKAIVRAEVMNRLIFLLEDNIRPERVFINVGNHDMINEKGQAHALDFLKPYADVIQTPMYVDKLESWVVPYQTSPDMLQHHLDHIPYQSRVILHQGIAGAYMGAYVQDKTSLPPEAFADFRVIASHYHRRQDIKTGRPQRGGAARPHPGAAGLFSYVGNFYSLSFAEAEDGPKGFQILNDDGTMTFVPTNLRKHVILHRSVETAFDPAPEFNPGDLVWMKITGPHSELEKLSKKQIGEKLFGHSNFKLDKIPTTVPNSTQLYPKGYNEKQLLDAIIDQQGETIEQKAYLKTLWREIYETT